MYIVYATNTRMKQVELKLVDLQTLQQVCSLLEASPEYTSYSVYSNGRKLSRNDLPQLSVMAPKFSSRTF
jgi:hypothetical protein